MTVAFRNGKACPGGLWQWGGAVILALGLMVTSAAHGEKHFDTSLSIKVLPTAQVRGEEICLSDVADIRGANKALESRIGDIALGQSPRPGKERSFSKKRIHALIMAFLDEQEKVHIEIPDAVCVQRAFQCLSETSLRQAFESYVAKRLGGIETSVSRFKIRGNDPLPLGRISLFPAGNISQKPIKGYFSLVMAVQVDGKNRGQLTLSGWVNRYEPVVCTTRYIPRGRTLTAEDVVLKKINTSKAPARLVRMPENAIGKQAKSSLRAGRAVCLNRLVSPPLIEKGDRVKILASSGGIQVTTLGVAMNEGRKGDQIKVENITSNKMVVGRVADHATVEVLF